VYSLLNLNLKRQLVKRDITNAMGIYINIEITKKEIPSGRYCRGIAVCAIPARKITAASSNLFMNLWSCVVAQFKH
jgi:hypothetical protein